MTAALPALRIPNLPRRIVLRGLAAGTAWVVTLSAGVASLEFYQCGLICPDRIAKTMLVSIAAGLVTIGPLAALRRHG